MFSKSFLTSKTLWGILIGILAEALKAHGMTVDSAGLTNDAVSLIGAALAAYGRFHATQPLHIIAPTTGK